jgi:2-keto-4-pentenoate hydratase/2-oxohepta-3-ene-1,7-dioic acid hydratase in catechol pathway
MIFSFGEALEEISRGLSLVPGDMLSGGTGAGTAIDTVSMSDTTEASWARWFLSAGELVESHRRRSGPFAIGL